MLFFRKKKKERLPEKTPKWFMWLMGGFIIYALATNVFSDKVSEIHRDNGEKTAAKKEGLNFVPVMQAVDPLPFYVHDAQMGQGNVAGCWEKVELRYRLYNSSNQEIENRMEEPTRFTIGRGEVIPALERGILGMREGGKREITARPEMAYGAPGFSHTFLKSQDFVGYKLQLDTISHADNLPLSNLGLRIYDDKIGEGSLAQCTDEVRVRIKGWNLSGMGLWDEKTVPALIVRIGKGEAPYAVEHALIGMKVGGKRTAIVPPGYMRPLFAQIETNPTGNKPEEADFSWQDLPIPVDNAIILELELLPRQLPTPNF